MRFKTIFLPLFVGGATCLALSGCLEAVGDLGGARESTLNRPRAAGALKAPAVEGLHYQSGDVTGETGASGEYIYEVGEDITFSIGGVTIGGVGGRNLVTPLNLSANGNINNTVVVNITRFLMMLDDNGDPSDGIRISDAVKEVAETWDPVDFTANNLDAQLVDIISSAASVDGTPHTLPDVAAAQAHLNAGLTCLYSGGFQGQIANGDAGRLGVIVNPNTRSLSGFVQSTQNPLQALRVITGLSELDFTQNQISLLGADQTAVQYTVRYVSLNQITGTWSSVGNVGGQPGGLAGGRLTPAALNMAYRFVGTYTGDDNGIFVLDIPLAGRVLGRMYSVTSDFTLVLNGSLENERFLAVTGEDGSTLFNGVIDWDTRVVSGDWENQFSDVRGLYSGAGCPLL